MDEPTLLSIFAGIGGFDLAFEAAGFRTIGFVEFDATKRIILESYWPEGPHFGDIDQFDCGEFLRAHGRPDVIAGGPPCQASSLLGERLGTTDHRWKWPQTIRLVGELRPSYCVFENPPAVLTVESGRAFNGIVSAMAALGYDGWWDVIPAAAFGAGHWRERLCIVFADAAGQRQRVQAEQAESIAGSGNARAISSGQGGERVLHPDAHSQAGQALSGSDSGVRGERRDGIINNDSSGAGTVLCSDTNIERRPEEGQRLPSGKSNDELWTESAADCSEPLLTHPDNPRSQRHSRNGHRSKGWSSARRPDATPGLPDLRGRVSGPDWWFDVIGGIPCVPSKDSAYARIPVLDTRLPNKLVEAASLCVGDSICPQAFYPIAKALYEALQAKEGTGP